MLTKTKPYSEKIHSWGRIWGIGAILIFIFYPLAVSVYYSAWPELGPFLKGLLGVAPVFWIVGAIEAFTYAPMLGAGGAYLGFVTGNLTNLKVPCAINAMALAKVKSGTEEGEVISTISIAVSSITTMVIIFLGVLLLAPLQPILESELLAPAFEYPPCLVWRISCGICIQELEDSLGPPDLYVGHIYFLPSPGFISFHHGPSRGHYSNKCIQNPI